MCNIKLLLDLDDLGSAVFLSFTIPMHLSYLDLGFNQLGCTPKIYDVLNFCG